MLSSKFVKLSILCASLLANITPTQAAIKFSDSPSPYTSLQEEINMPELVMYIRKTCPYCQKVMRFLEENSRLVQEKHLNIVFKDIGTEPAFKEKLQKIGGKTQVPCLVIDQKALYESDLIIDWLKNNLKIAHP